MLDNLLLKEFCPGLPDASGHNMGPQGTQPLSSSLSSHLGIFASAFDDGLAWIFFCLRNACKMPLGSIEVWLNLRLFSRAANENG